MVPRTVTVMPTEFRFDLDDLVELLGGELGAQPFDRLFQILAGLAARDRGVGEPVGECEGLFFVLRAARPFRALGDRDQRVGEVAPCIELTGSDTELRLSGSISWRHRPARDANACHALSRDCRGARCRCPHAMAALPCRHGTRPRPK